MAYSKQTWKTGDDITADKLNHLEDGIASVETTPGPKGADGKDGAKGSNGTNGKDGASLTKIVLTKGEDGEITGGTGTLSDGNTIPITV